MAEIDKGLPNVRQSVTIPSPDEKVEIETHRWRKLRAIKSRVQNKRQPCIHNRHHHATVANTHWIAHVWQHLKADLRHYTIVARI